MNQPPVLTDTFSADTPGNPLKAGVDTASSALHSTIDKAIDPTLNSVNRLASAAHQTVDKLAHSAGNVAEKFADEARRVKQAPAQAVDYSKSWVQERPLEAVGAALAIGFLIGRLTR
jgi:ElaB/YqjD/DUF883 family membrane-anchored ribosome-binding protein